jgi:hypothetical protein
MAAEPPPGMGVPSDFAGVPRVPSGIEIGARAGYALPLGNASGNANDNLSNYVNGAIPIFLEAGYRVARPNLSVGIYFAYEAGLVNTSANGGLNSMVTQYSKGTANCSSNGISCSANVLMYGAQLHYHLMPEASFDPWIGAGVGMESFNFSLSGGNASLGGSVTGWDYLILQLGGDYRAAPNFGLGPVAWFGMGQYGNVSVTAGGTTASAAINNGSLHEWLTVGVRGVLDFPVGH